MIDDAPYRAVPAHPPLKKKGESLSDLGFASFEKLQSNISKRSPVNAVAISGDGGAIASGSSDRTVKPWDADARREVQTLLGGQRGNWAIIENQQRLFRGDDGTFLRKQIADKKGWKPVSIIDMSEKDDLSLKLVTSPAPLQPGRSREVAVQITNNGAQAAYWLSLLPAQSKDKTIRLDSPNREFKGKGRQPWKADRIAKLEAGETASLHARIFPNLKHPAEFVDPGKRDITLTVISANGTEVSQTIQVDLQSPRLEWQKTAFDRKTETLKIKLINSGTFSLKESLLSR